MYQNQKEDINLTKDEISHLTRSQNIWIREILKENINYFYTQDFLTKYNTNQRLGSANINDNFFRTIIDRTRQRVESLHLLLIILILIINFISGDDRCLNLIYDMIQPVDFLDKKQEQDLKDLLVELLGKLSCNHGL